MIKTLAMDGNILTEHNGYTFCVKYGVFRKMAVAVRKSNFFLLVEQTGNAFFYFVNKTMIFRSRWKKFTKV